jgi:Family of unknown function (DUF5941)
MTVALVLAAEPAAGLRGQLTSLGVQRVDATDNVGSNSILLSIAAAARATSEPMLICGGDLSVPRQALARLLDAEGTAGYAEARGDCRAILVGPSDLRVLAEAAEYLVSGPQTPDHVSALMGELVRRGVTVWFVEARPDGDADRDEDGLVAELFADPIARDVARWASERALAPAALMGISLGLGLVSAIWFTEPTAPAKAFGAVTLLAAFVTSRAGRALAAAPGPVLEAIGALSGLGGRPASRTSVIQPAADWLSAAGWAITECAVYAGLAASAGLGSAALGSAGLGSAGLGGPGLRVGFTVSGIGSGSGGVWHLAVAALAVLAVRQMAGLCYERAAEEFGGRTRLAHSARRRRIERALLLPAGERVVLLIVTGGIWGPRVAFLALIGWGVLAAGYLLTARIIGLRDAAVYGSRVPSGGVLPADEGSITLEAAAGPFGALSAFADGSRAADGNGGGNGGGSHGEEGSGAGGDALSALGLRPTGTAPSPAPWRSSRSRTAASPESTPSYQVAAYRDDGPLSLWLGRLVEGRIPPLPPALVGVFVTVALTLLGLRNLSGVLVLTPVEAMLLAGLGSCHPHDGRLDWLVPPLLQVGEYLFLAALAFTRLVSPPLVFALIAAVVLRHLDVAYRARHRILWPAAGSAASRRRKPRRTAEPTGRGRRPGQQLAGQQAAGRPARAQSARAQSARAQSASAQPAGEQPASQQSAGDRGAAASHGLTWPPRAADGRPADVIGLGWELRMLALGVGAALGIMPFACIALAAYLWALVGRDFLTGWLGVRDEPARAPAPARPAQPA